MKVHNFKLPCIRKNYIDLDSLLTLQVMEIRKLMVYSKSLPPLKLVTLVNQCHYLKLQTLLTLVMSPWIQNTTMTTGKLTVPVHLRNPKATMHLRNLKKMIIPRQRKMTILIVMKVIQIWRCPQRVSCIWWYLLDYITYYIGSNRNALPDLLSPWAEVIDKDIKSTLSGTEDCVGWNQVS